MFARERDRERDRDSARTRLNENEIVCVGVPTYVPIDVVEIERKKERERERKRDCVSEMMMWSGALATFEPMPSSTSSSSGDLNVRRLLIGHRDCAMLIETLFRK